MVMPVCTGDSAASHNACMTGMHTQDVCLQVRTDSCYLARQSFMSHSDCDKHIFLSSCSCVTIYTVAKGAIDNSAVYGGSQ